ncbi:MAG: tripartite tricarboxylate transporter substrate binding protein [Castellaniella sp.]
MVFRKFVMALGAMAVSAAAAVAADYPERSISFVVPYGPGGASDVAARLITQKMSEKLGQTIVVENKPGAGGMLGVGYVARQKADGYTIGMLPTSSTALAPYMSPITFTLDDLALIGSVVGYQFGLAVNAGSPYQTIDDLIEAAKKESLFYGSTSVTFLLAGMRLGELTGGSYEIVNYKSGPEVITAVLSNDIQVASQHPSGITPYVRDGKLRFLVSIGETRWTDFPEIPTLKEMGLDVIAASEIAFFAPAGTPEAILGQLQAAAFEATNDPGVRKQLQDLGLQVTNKPADQVRQWMIDYFNDSAAPLSSVNAEWVLKGCFVNCKK